MTRPSQRTTGIGDPVQTERETEVLRRMLNTPPKPHKVVPAKRRAKNGGAETDNSKLLPAGKFFRRPVTYEEVGGRSLKVYYRMVDGELVRTGCRILEPLDAA